MIGRWAIVVVGTGICGAFTTFSTFCFESMSLFEEGANRATLWNVGGSVVAGVGAAP